MSGQYIRLGARVYDALRPAITGMLASKTDRHGMIRVERGSLVRVPLERLRKPPVNWREAGLLQEEYMREKAARSLVYNVRRRQKRIRDIELGRF